MGNNEIILSLRGIAKSFPGVRALKGVSFDVRPGTILGLLGENGAGKSTLIKIISGAQLAGEGEIRWQGNKVQIASPQAAQQLGIVTIYQEFNLVGSLSVAENIFLGRQPRTANRLVDWRGMNRAALAVMRRIGLQVSPDCLVSTLSIAQQQMVEISRALTMDAKLIIMDEPTAALSQAEVVQLMGIMRRLRQDGVSIMFVTHRLEEVMEICDEIVIMRDGEFVESRRRPDFSIEFIIEQMVGRQAADLYNRLPNGFRGLPKVALSVRDLSTTRGSGGQRIGLQGVTFDLHAGEILGLAGLVGAGRSEIARAIFGADPMSAGTVYVDGREASISSPQDAIKAGIGLVPEDRKQQALFLSHSVRTNFSIANLANFSRSGFMRQKLELIELERMRKSLNIKMAQPEHAVGALSGGNQQKVILARWLTTGPKVLIVDEPTRGIDVGAKSEVHHLLRALADAGIGVLVISSDLLEVIAVSDRILTISEGRLTGEFPGPGATEEILMSKMASLSRPPKAAMGAQ